MNAIAEPVNAGIERLESVLLNHPQVECPLTHEFSDNLYVRTIFMRAGLGIIGHCHRTRHWNCLWRGRCFVSMDGEVKLLQAPCRFISEPGVRKVLIILEDCEWSTLHVTRETDLAKLEEELIVKSESFLAHEHDMLKLHAAIERSAA